MRIHPLLARPKALLRAAGDRALTALRDPVILSLLTLTAGLSGGAVMLLAVLAAVGGTSALLWGGQFDPLLFLAGAAAGLIAVRCAAGPVWAGYAVARSLLAAPVSSCGTDEDPVPLTLADPPSPTGRAGDQP